MEEVNCKNCSANFEVTDDDLEFYRKVKTPPPTHCPDCRRQRRLAIRNERNLHPRTCDKCSKKVISVYPQDSDYIVWCNQCWYKDDWDVMDYGREYDFQRPFFAQYAELEKSIPHFAIFQDGENENCEYVNYGVGNKSCYMAFCAFSEDIYHSYGPIKSKSCIDCYFVDNSELCYECIDCDNCYNLKFSKECYNCSDSMFLENCIGCSNCFCSAGLRNKKYVFENIQLAEEEYKRKIAEIKLTNNSIQEWEKRKNELSLKTPKKYYHGKGNQNVEGNYIENCKDLKDCFGCLGGLEKSSFCDFCGYKTHHVYDAYATGIGTEFSYELNGVTYHNNCKFIYYTRQLQDCDYCQICFNGKKLFGCFGLKHKQFCILNKQYSEEEYEKLIPKIIEHMKSTGEYGEFFPISIFPIGYNDSIAFEYYPMTKEEAKAKGYRWTDPTPQKHMEVSEDIRQCTECSTYFKIINNEKEFYKKMELPTPIKCPNCRHKDRFVQRLPKKLYDRKCMKCEIDLRTPYAPDRPEIIYCEPCYHNAMA